MRRFFRWIIYGPRTFKVDVLTLFLTLNLLSLGTVFFFTRSSNYEVIVDSSKETARQSSALVLQKFRTIALSSERMIQTSSSFLEKLGPISPNNELFTRYLLDIIDYDASFTTLFIGTTKGEFLGVYGRNFAAEIEIEDQKVPKDTAFVMRFIQKGQGTPINYWYFLDDKFRVLGTMTSDMPEYDATTHVWYKEALSSQVPYWSVIQAYVPGVIVSYPAYDEHGQLIGVMGADLSFALLDDFIKQQKVGITGKVFILDEKGKVIVPREFDESKKVEELIASAYASSEMDKGFGGLILKQNGVEYLTHVIDLPVFTTQGWKIGIVVPLDDFFGETIKIQHELLLLIGIIILISILIIAYFANRISSPIVKLADEVNKISELKLDSQVRMDSMVKEIALIDSSVAAMRRALRSFARYVPKEIVKDLLQTSEEISLGGKKQEITIFFSDISSFTSIVESYPIDLLAPLLKEYFDAMSKIILETHGTIDKFIGDGIMAFWGAPIHFPDHTLRACTAALRCRSMLNHMNKRRREEGKPEFLTRFGINTGTVIVGNIGTEERMNYTAIGDAVNLTSRFPEVDKIYHTAIIISQDVYKKLGNDFIARPLDVVSVKGKKEKIKIYELGGKINGDEDIRPSEEQIALFSAFTQAYEVFDRKEFQKAEALFKTILEKFPEDFPTQLYLQRLSNQAK